MASTLLSHWAPKGSSKPYYLTRQHEAVCQRQQHVWALRHAALQRSQQGS